MKRAYVVVGPESAGNRLLAGLLIRAGCIGSASMMQGPLPVYEDPAVIVRSYPHGNHWPDLREVFAALRDRGYVVRFVVAVRDPYCVAASQTARQHHPPDLARANLRRAYLEIFGQLGELNAWFTLVPYEALVLHSTACAWRLLEELGLPTDNLGGELVVEGRAYESIEDGNAKHHAPPPAPEVS